jgi:hypothetical protein
MSVDNRKATEALIPHDHRQAIGTFA